MNLPDEFDLEMSLEALLSEQADALIAGTHFEPDFNRFALPQSHIAQANDLFQLAESLGDALTTAEPSAEFVGMLKNELIGNQPVTLIVRWRKLPAHYQLAAKLGGMAISAGIMLLAARQGLNSLQAKQRRSEPDADSNLAHGSAG